MDPPNFSSQSFDSSEESDGHRGQNEQHDELGPTESMNGVPKMRTNSKGNGRNVDDGNGNQKCRQVEECDSTLPSSSVEQIEIEKSVEIGDVGGGLEDIKDSEIGVENNGDVSSLGIDSDKGRKELSETKKVCNDQKFRGSISSKRSYQLDGDQSHRKRGRFESISRIDVSKFEFCRDVEDGLDSSNNLNGSYMGTVSKGSISLFGKMERRESMTSTRATSVTSGREWSNGRSSSRKEISKRMSRRNISKTELLRLPLVEDNFKCSSEIGSSNQQQSGPQIGCGSSGYVLSSLHLKSIIGSLSNGLMMKIAHILNNSLVVQSIVSVGIVVVLSCLLSPSLDQLLELI